jgi:hypothetical protein
MTQNEFNTMQHHANTFVMYQGKQHYVISVDFREQLFGLVEEKEAVPKDEWLWVRCENVTLINPDEKTIN